MCKINEAYHDCDCCILLRSLGLDVDAHSDEATQDYRGVGSDASTLPVLQRLRLICNGCFGDRLTIPDAVTSTSGDTSTSHQQFDYGPEVAHLPSVQPADELLHSSSKLQVVLL